MMARSLYNGIISVPKNTTHFLYDSFANIYGRDCINFTALLYHGMPFLAGLDGIDYTNLKQLINEQFRNSGFITRLATMDDVQGSWIASGGDISVNGLGTYILKSIPIGKGLVDISDIQKKLSPQIW
jgi:hypothetical protein